MRFAETIVGFDPDERYGDNVHYQRLKTRAKWVMVGSAAMAAGVLSDILGVREGFDVAVGGVPVFYAGMVGVSREVDVLLSQHENE